MASTSEREAAEAAFEELRRRTEGAAALSFSEALEYLDSDDTADLIEAAGLADLSTRTIFERLTGFRLTEFRL